MESFRRVPPGGRWRQAELARLMQAVVAAGNPTGGLQAVNAFGVHQAPRPPRMVWATITDYVVDNHGPANGIPLCGYHTHEVLEYDHCRSRHVDGVSMFCRTPPGLFLPSWPAYEVNGCIAPPGSVVQLWRGNGDYWLFFAPNDCPGSGSGAEESGSGSGEGSGSGSGSGAGGSGGGGCDPPPTDTTLYLSFTQTGDTPSFCDCITSPIVMTYNPAGALGPGWYGSTSYFWPCHIAPGFLWSIDAALVNCCGASLCGDSFCELAVSFTGQSCSSVSTISCVRARRPLLHTFDFVGSGNCADPCGGGTTWQFTLTE